MPAITKDEAIKALDELADEAASNGNTTEPGGWLAKTVAIIRSAITDAAATQADSTPAAPVVAEGLIVAYMLTWRNGTRKTFVASEPNDFALNELGNPADLVVTPLAAHPVAGSPAEARNFCPVCGKRTPPGNIHTCTPPAAEPMPASEAAKQTLPQSDVLPPVAAPVSPYGAGVSMLSDSVIIGIFAEGGAFCTIPQALSIGRALETKLASGFREARKTSDNDSANFAAPAAPTDAKPDDDESRRETWKNGYSLGFETAKSLFAAQSVRDALEQAAKIVMDAPLIRAGGEYPYMDDACKAMALTASNRIRALIQSPQAPVGDSK